LGSPKPERMVFIQRRASKKTTYEHPIILLLFSSFNPVFVYLKLLILIYDKYQS
jgi:hypothetical protein